MFFKHKTVIICSTFFLLSLITGVFSEKNSEEIEGNTGFGDENNGLTDDELSYALSELSVDDLKTLNKLMDALSEEGGIGDIGEESFLSSEGMSDKFSRFKRENSDNSAKNDKNNGLSNVDEEYIRQLDDSFPNAIDQANQEDKEKAHIRVKRY